MPTSKTKIVISARPAPSRPPIEGPSAWIGSDMRGREAEWTYRLSPSEIVEIETCGVEFAPDSPLEGSGFEPSVPLAGPTSDSQSVPIETPPREEDQ
jgi:hypothetical protein